MLAEKLQLEQMLKQNQQQPNNIGGRMRPSMGHQNNNNNSSEVQPTWNNGGGW
jgi:hypothetical protein